jgi:DNA replication protein DnaC
VLRKYAKYDCLVIDEVGYVEVEAAQVGLFFTLMQKRHKTRTTLITSNLGFSEWGSFLKNNQLTGALIDRLTATSHDRANSLWRRARSLRQVQMAHRKRLWASRPAVNPRGLAASEVHHCGEGLA